MSRRDFPATNRFVCNGFFLCENLRLRNRILSQKHVAKNQIIQNFATYCGDKILLQTHEAICRCNVSPQRVASTSRPTCTHQLICRRDVLLQLVARPVHTEWYVATTCCCNLSPDLYTRSDMWPRLVAATCHPTCTHGQICGLDLLLQLVA